MNGILYIVSTPIGNLEDITLRALRILREADIIAAEDTRRSIKLLNHYGIKKPVISYYREKEQRRSEEIIRRLLGGQSVALISDAGTPGISDPGSVIIQKAVGENLEIVPVPGPSAFVAALSVSGLPTGQFTYCGFLPARRNQRRNAIAGLRFEQRTLIFYEAPHRVIDSLLDLADILGERRAALIKELTKLHEQVIRGNIPAIVEEVQKTTIAGEYVIIVEGCSRIGAGVQVQEEILSELSSYMRKGLGRKEAVGIIAAKYGVSKKELYRKSLGDNSG